MSGKKKITSTLTFKVLCVIFILILFVLAYNFVVNVKNAPTNVDEVQEEEQVKASKDTIDIIGDYLWKDTPKPKMVEEKKEDESGDKAEPETKKSESRKKSASASTSLSERQAEPMPAPAQETPSATMPESSAKQHENASTVERMESPKVEKID